MMNSEKEVVSQKNLNVKNNKKNNWQRIVNNRLNNSAHIFEWLEKKAFFKKMIQIFFQVLYSMTFKNEDDL